MAARDLAPFSLGTLPDDAKGRQRAEVLAADLHAYLGGRRMTHGEAGHGLGIPPNRLRYVAATGTVLIRWGGARAPTIWTVPPPEVDVWTARLELARRYLHVYGPTTARSFARCAGIGPRHADAAFAALELLPVRATIGEAWMLASDEAWVRAAPGSVAPARLLPSGDAYFLLHGADRRLLLPDARRRGELWTSRVWPGALLVDGEVVGTWRRADEQVTARTWRRLSRVQRDAVEAEAASLPLPGIDRAIVVRWDA